MSEISTNESKNEKKIGRISSIDKFRGILVFVFLISHTSEAWLLPTDQWIHGIIHILSHMMGANAWLFASGISLTISYESKRRKVTNDPEYSNNRARLSIWWRSFFVLFVALASNIISSLNIGRFDVWLWWVIQTIAVGRMVVYPCLRTKPITRVLLGLLFFILTYPLADFLSQSAEPIYFIFYNPSHLNTPFPFFGYIFIGSAVGTYLYHWKKGMERGSKRKRYFTPKTLGILGLICITLPLIFGMQNSNGDVARRFLSLVNLYGYKDWSYLPVVFDGRSILWCIFSLGLHLTTFSFFFWKDYKIDHKDAEFDNIEVASVKLNKSGILEKSQKNSNIKHRKSMPNNILTILGRNSLTIFNYHFIIVYFIFKEAISIIWYFPVYITFTLLIYILFKYWTDNRYGKGIGTLEWMIKVSHEKVEKLLKIK